MECAVRVDDVVVVVDLELGSFLAGGSLAGDFSGLVRRP